MVFVTTSLRANDSPWKPCSGRDLSIQIRNIHILSIYRYTRAIKQLNSVKLFNAVTDQTVQFRLNEIFSERKMENLYCFI